MRLAHRPADRRATAGDEGGAVIVEFAIVALFLVTLLAGTFDLGMGWRSGLGVNESVRAGSRVGSAVGRDEHADIDLLTSTQAALASSGLLDEVERVVVYRATQVDGKVPTTCVTGTTGACNIFTGPQFRAISDSSPLDPNGCIQDSARKGWCPLQRNDVQIDADYLGVWVQVRKANTFRLFGSHLTIERASVMRLEP